jgi:GT2 family glycosyltransferase/glycosyltransferase involved in cell wall biosynthesis
MIDIIVPVYGGRDETLACLDRVLTTTARMEAELVVINDASPDSELCGAIARLAQDGSITLLTNRSNLGFPGAANRGLNLHPGRDIVLLNADTELFGDWLERLKFAAYCADDIGTVTPLGEFASITSYPGKTDCNHTIADAEEIDGIAREVNARKVVELPVGVGYCLYIKRACLAEVGGFDESSFGKGYGEENDFCLRARGRGWRHVAAIDLFVRHRGGRSYGGMKRALTERNRRVLNALHPGYEAMIADFVAADPLLDARRAIDMHRLCKKTTEPILLMTFDLPGGVQRHVQDRVSELMAAGHSVIVLQPSRTDGRADQVILNAQDRDLENLAFNLPEELSILRAFLLRLQLSYIELHHFVGLPPDALELVSSLGIRYDVYVHDYSWVCPRVALVGGNGVYCGEPPIEDCENCIRKHGTALEESLTVKALRARSTRILEGAATVVVPSNDVRARFARYFPSVPVKVMAWETPIEPVARSTETPVGRVRVAVIGALSIPKGYQVLLQCAQDAAQRNLDLEFVVIGYTYNDEALLATGRVFITGVYAEHEVGTLLEREQCHIAFFPSVAPETWCYALSHALARGLRIIAFDLGAIAERLHGFGAAKLLPLLTTAAGINDTLLTSARSSAASDAQKELAMDPTPTTNKETLSHELAASVQLLTLPVGIYSFTVQDGAPTTSLTEELALPALQVGLAPMKSPGTVEFLAGATTLDRWLTRSSDVIIVRISGGSASLLLTSVRSPSSSVLAIDVRRADAELHLASPELQAGEPTTDRTPGGLPTLIVAHIHNLGDINFTDGWAGCFSEKLWIEAFAIMSVGQLTPDMIEYCGITADGLTAWMSNQMLCGSRGQGMPLMGYAIRLKPEVSGNYDVTYTGRFASAGASGLFKNGEICCSDVPGDPLWGIELRVEPRSVSQLGEPSAETP